jgi:biotin synthase-like enzyme
MYFTITPEQRAEEATAIIEDTSPEEFARAQLAYETFHPTEERSLTDWATLRPVYVVRWINTVRALFPDA